MWSIEARWASGGLSIGEPKEKKAGLGMWFTGENLSKGGVSSALAFLDGAQRWEGKIRAQKMFLVETT